jgi:Trypsin
MKWCSRESAPVCAAFVLFVSAGIAAFGSSEPNEFFSATEQALRAADHAALHQSITAWYRLCPSGSVGTESSVVIWPADVELRVDLRSTRVTAAPNNGLLVSVDALQVESAKPAAGPADSMLAPVQFDLTKQRDDAVQHFEQLTDLPRFVAATYFRTHPAQVQEAALAAIRQLATEALWHSQIPFKLIRVEFRPTPVEAEHPPTLELCPGTLLLVNGFPILQNHEGKLESVNNGTQLPLITHSPRRGTQSPAATTRDESSAGAPRYPESVGTAYSLPNFLPLGQARTLKKIAGGTKAPPGKYPFAVALALELPDRYAQFCGGTLVAKDLVLTAAHCPIALGQVAVIGAVDLNNLRQPGVEIIPVNPYDKPHNAAGYGFAAKYDADLQLVRLARPAAAKPTKVTNQLLQPGDELTAIGWGATETGQSYSVLMQALLKVNGMQACKAYYADEIRADPYTYGMTEQMLCVGGGPTATCDGDSGGPLLLGKEVAATVSFGAVCQNASQAPTLFIPLSAYPGFVPP